MGYFQANRAAVFVHDSRLVSVPGMIVSPCFFIVVLGKSAFDRNVTCLPYCF